MQTMPVVNGIEEDFGNELQVVRLNFNDGENDAAIAALGVRGHPTIVLLNGDGEIHQRWFGAATDNDLRPLVQELLAP